MTGLTDSTIVFSTGLTSIYSSYSIKNPIYTKANMLITNPSSGEELLRITNDGKIYYKFENEMIKVNCPEDISEAN